MDEQLYCHGCNTLLPRINFSKRQEKRGRRLPQRPLDKPLPGEPELPRCHGCLIAQGDTNQHCPYCPDPRYQHRREGRGSAKKTRRRKPRRTLRKKPRRTLRRKPSRTRRRR